MKIKRALSIRQPFAEQIMGGKKKWEYRGRRTNIRERVYVYASKTPGPAERWKKVRREPGELPVGVLVGSVEIAACKGNRGDYAWKLVRPKRLKRLLKPKTHPQPAFFYPF